MKNKKTGLGATTPKPKTTTKKDAVSDLLNLPKHFVSLTELQIFADAYFAAKITPLENTQWRVMFTKLGSVRRAKKLYDWEMDNIRQDKLYCVVASQNETIDIVGADGQRYTKRVASIPVQDYYAFTDLVHEGRIVSSDKVKIAKAIVATKPNTSISAGEVLYGFV